MIIRLMMPVAAILSMACAQVNDVRPRVPNSIYVSPDRTFIFAVVNNLLYVGSYPVQEGFEILPEIMGSQGPLTDMSTPSVRCVASGHLTFAVPRASLRRFECNGLEFAVDQCQGENCETYVITATCRDFIDGRCIAAGTGQTPVARTYRFRGSKRGGIREIDFDPASETGEVTLSQGPGLFGQVPAQNARDRLSGSLCQLGDISAVAVVDAVLVSPDFENLLIADLNCPRESSRIPVFSSRLPQANIENIVSDAQAERRFGRAIEVRLRGQAQLRNGHREFVIEQLTRGGVIEFEMPRQPPPPLP